jgi:hypothetical protein
MLYDSKMMKSYPKWFAVPGSPSLQAAPDAPVPALRAARSFVAAGGVVAVAGVSLC